MTDLATAAHEGEHPARWKWFLALGLVLPALGAVGFGYATLLETSSLLVFGPLLLTSSLFQMVTAFFAESWEECLQHYVAAGLEMLLGFFIMMHPLTGLMSLTAWVAIGLVAIGLARLARPLVAKPRGWGRTAPAGIVALCLGVATWIVWPVTEVWIVGAFLAVDLICHGLSWSALALAERRLSQAQAAPATATSPEAERIASHP